MVQGEKEQKITKGFPGDRRKYLDKLYATVSNKYLKTLTAYTRILKQRNALLKTEKREPTLLVWDEQLAEAAVKVWSEKKELCQKRLRRNTIHGGMLQLM